ncbi:MAG: [FeFe] hydrogenase H-cluster radical SAM maturase HydG [Bdellovibrionales bacterium RIFOXYB1_FULL_37_110]|nr:MAG: [FeFe] hydrogenase H-cluster radical SAM maturase HydG [Bdellovibrionales bacterium RIFOXYC1_FULL_37_79]OFZ58194.1 MAG: [FeFe] hydrogenase H-cluster radical SAM maturase HydG [Bdellovibrionales bacterium RIFOXYB1_FULL_37_110]OFZ61883.1 MAG: [FeFe] hydrogenase H-cluster radical SAM maturase HydG [Bdellovibrionales bacterium RIFOXYD1_FULL_36_51]
MINHDQIMSELNATINTSPNYILEILDQAKKMKGLTYHQVLSLLHTNDPGLLNVISQTASYIKDEIYGKRLVLFAPLYISNLCNNECLYCAFRNHNHKLSRRALDQHEIGNETKNLIGQGHKRILLVAGEAYGKQGLQYILDAINTIYSIRSNNHSIKRINVNIAPLETDEFRRLNESKIGTYQLFQETYHEATYKMLHTKGPKANFDYRLSTMDRAFRAGIKDVGIGLLFGLYDWKYEVLALLQHINHLEKEYGIGPHTISVPRLEPAYESRLSYHPPYPVADRDFKKIIAVLRLAVPYTGIILSTRENSSMRKEAFALGVSQISAGSKTNPGGYATNDVNLQMDEQFSLGDTRSLLEVTKDIVHHGYLPSFCTGCYRMGRVGADFMDLAKPGLIKQHCLPNAIFTFKEYLNDFADDELKINGNKLIQNILKKDIGMIQQADILQNIHQIDAGKRDVYY